ncbi:hypothetical protein HLV38_05910 [Berryella wangjianweii]|uniref:HTH luxR-type domain-containing protein n=1 Tax=Berryella wangjianweii TaxID=2734634 RepID=A0A6M8J724_9ACTN|nr:hypothetical protein HLV38_05910 [Berryella wangjianweii]
MRSVAASSGWWVAGFSACMAWSYHTLFLSALGIARDPLWCDAWVWGFVEGSQAVAALACGFVLARAVRNRPGLRLALCGMTAVTGSVLIGVGHLEGAGLSSVTAVGEALCGIGLALLFLIWGRRLSLLDEADAELLMLVSFGLGALGCVGLLMASGPLRVVLSAVLAALACWLGCFGEGRARAVPPVARNERSTPEARAVAGCAGGAGGVGAGGMRTAVPAGCVADAGGAALSASAAGGVALVTAAIRRRSHELSVFLLCFLIWFLFAFFRILAAPSLVAGDVLMAPFSLAFILVGAGLALCLMYSRYTNFTLVFRWALPLVTCACGVVFATGARNGHVLAYLINFVALFGAQAICLIAAVKHARRTGVSSFFLFGGLLAAQGSAVVCGTVVGLRLFAVAEPVQMAGVSLLAVGAVTLAVMMMGFGPRWVPNGGATAMGAAAPPAPAVGAECAAAAGSEPAAGASEPPMCAEPPCAKAEAAGSGVACRFGNPAACVNAGGDCDRNVQDQAERLFMSEALQLSRRFALTQRETQVAALLLAGRNRPYIRDELVISLHTVHAHARSIFAKCQVHSQQELIDLARSTD